MISVVILTKNSAKYIERCLGVLQAFPEVVVVDNGSTDQTMEIAAGFANVKLYQREFCGFGPLKNIGAQLAKHDWVFFVDSDEIVSPELVQKILGQHLSAQEVYRFYRKNYYAGRLINGCNWDNDYVVRLYNRKITSFNDNQVHESIQTNNLTVTTLSDKSSFIYHFPYNNTRQLMTKLEHYADLYAVTKLGHKKVRLWTVPFRFFMAFIKSYVLKKGFKYGYEGFLISSYNAMGVLVKYLKLYELSTAKSCVIALKIANQQELANAIRLINAQTLVPSRVIFLFSELLSQQMPAMRKLLAENLIPAADCIVYDTQDVTQTLSNYQQDNADAGQVIFFFDVNSLTNIRIVEFSLHNKISSDRIQIFYKC
jgi:glycosyltransferase involved in cell wall biosynthesis